MSEPLRKKRRAVASRTVRGALGYAQPGVVPDEPVGPVVQFSQEHENSPLDLPNTGEEVKIIVELPNHPQKRGQGKSSMVHRYFNSLNGETHAICLPCKSKSVVRVVNLSVTSVGINHLRDNHSELPGVKPKNTNKADTIALQKQCVTKEEFWARIALWIAETAQPFTDVLYQDHLLLLCLMKKKVHQKRESTVLLIAVLIMPVAIFAFYVMPLYAHEMLTHIL
jgi:hypothetical protein